MWLGFLGLSQLFGLYEPGPGVSLPRMGAVSGRRVVTRPLGADFLLGWPLISYLPGPGPMFSTRKHLVFESVPKPKLTALCFAPRSDGLYEPGPGLVQFSLFGL